MLSIDNFLKELGIPKSSSEAVRFVTNEDKEWTLHELLQHYAEYYRERSHLTDDEKKELSEWLEFRSGYGEYCIIKPKEGKWLLKKIKE